MSTPVSPPVPSCEGEEMREFRARDYHHEVDDGSVWDMLSEEVRDCYRQSADRLYAKWCSGSLAQLSSDPQGASDV
jgi:hypothetical protein